jgi:hypothetical protein
MATKGTLMFPNDAIFTNLINLSNTVSDIGYHDLFDDIFQLRQAFKERLPAESFDSRGLLRPEYGCIASITTSVYYFLVAFFTIASFGGACVPLCELEPDWRLHIKMKACSMADLISLSLLSQYRQLGRNSLLLEKGQCLQCPI